MENIDPVPLNLIGTAREPGRGAAVAAQHDPATGSSRPIFRKADTAQVAAAVHAAQISDWGNTTLAQRIAALSALRDQIATYSQDFARIISREIGAPIDFARTAQVGAALSHLDATIAAMPAALREEELDGAEHRIRFEPVGVSALITPWNWPLNQIVLKLGAALAAGCAVVLKPSELSPRTAGLLIECCLRAGIPPGAVNLLIGDAETGAQLVRHGGIGHISFTGSTRAGRQIAAVAASRFARSTLELGGKSANILFADCDLETAIRQGTAHCVRNAGQSCNAASRMLVERPIYAQAVALTARHMHEIAVDLPDVPGNHIGPQVSSAQYLRVQQLIAQGIAEKARLVSGGPGLPDGLTAGFFSRPTLFADVTPDMKIFQTEIFGPVLTITPFETEEEAIALANATPYGLAAYVQTTDPARADRVSRALHAGMIQVNGTSRAQGAPFGGVGASGWGREAGLWGIRAFQEIKSISGAAAVRT